MPMMEANREPSWLDNIPYNPALMAGLSILGTQPGGNWGPAGAQAMGNTAKLGMARTEWERQQAQRALQQKIWGEAFPGGQANAQHPLLKGVPPELAATVYAMGPDEGLPQLGKLSLMTAEARMKLAMEQQQQQQMLDVINKIAQQRQTPQQPPQPSGLPSMSPAAPFNAESASMPGVAVGGGVPGIATPSQSPAPAPASSAPPVAPQTSGITSPFNDPLFRQQAMLDIIGKDPKALGNSFSQYVARATAPAQAGATTFAQKQAEELAAKPQARAALASTLDSLNRMEAEAKAIQSDPALSGITGAYGQLPDWMGGKAADVRARLHSLINQTGLATMQALKSGAQHGNAGFRITNQKEFEALQSTLAGLDTKQSTESMKRALQQIIDFSAKSRSHLQGSWKETYGQDYEEPGGGQPQQTVYPTRLQRPAPPKPGQVIDGYRYKGMGDPAKQSSWVKVE